MQKLINYGQKSFITLGPGNKKSKNIPFFEDKSLIWTQLTFLSKSELIWNSLHDSNALAYYAKKAERNLASRRHSPILLPK